MHISYISLLVSSMKLHKDLNIFKFSFTLTCLNPFRIVLHVTSCELEIVFNLDGFSFQAGLILC